MCNITLNEYSLIAGENLLMKSISAKVAWPHADGIKPHDDLWLAFLLGNGLLHTDNLSTQTCVHNLRFVHVFIVLYLIHISLLEM